jgi:hypothetical protein
MYRGSVSTDYRERVGMGGANGCKKPIFPPTLALTLQKGVRTFMK